MKQISYNFRSLLHPSEIHVFTPATSCITRISFLSKQKQKMQKQVANIFISGLKACLMAHASTYSYKYKKNHLIFNGATSSEVDGSP